MLVFLPLLIGGFLGSNLRSFLAYNQDISKFFLWSAKMLNLQLLHIFFLQIGYVLFTCQRYFFAEDEIAVGRAKLSWVVFFSYIL